MAFSLFRKKPDPAPVYALYTAIVAQSRRPRFYAEWGVPDTVTGRFDMISLHLSVVFCRLRGEGESARNFAQGVFDVFFLDMDRSLREMGVGDLGVGKKIEKMSSLFYGLLANVSDALTEGDQEVLEAVLRRNIYAETAGEGAASLAAYLLGEARHLAAAPTAAITSGAVRFGELP